LPQLRGQIGIKWPNDLLLGAQRDTAGKLGGILVESSFYGTTVQHAVIGMGINVLQRTPDLPTAPPTAPPPTSLYAYLSTGERGAPADDMPVVDRTALLIALCNAWAHWLTAAATQPDAAAAIFTHWRTQLWTIGEQVTVQQTTQGVDATFVGTAVDVTPAGHLVVRDREGTSHELVAGDVTIRRVASHSRVGF
jgi:biotin-(acetyl-CoA carboxylase) ligase